MPKLKTHYRWGETMCAIQSLIPTSDVTRINAESRRQIKKYITNSLDVEGEGYQTAVVAFEVESAENELCYTLALEYCYHGEEWLLEIDSPPDFTALDHRRRPRKPRSGGLKRVVLDVLATARVFAADSGAAAQILLYKIRQAVGAAVGPDLAKFMHDTGGMSGFGVLWSWILTLGEPRDGGVNLAFNNAEEKTLNDDGFVVQLVRTRAAGALAFLGPIWSWEMPRPPYAVFDGEWDCAWFGQVQ